MSKVNKNRIDPDDNLISLFSTKVLSDVLKGKYDLNYHAKVEMANRGLDEDGKWVGFDKAEKIHNI